VIGVGEEGAEGGVEPVELLPAVALVCVVADLTVGSRAAGGGTGLVRRRGRRRDAVVPVEVEVEVDVKFRPLLVSPGTREDICLQRGDAAGEGVVEELVLVPHCWPGAPRLIRD
jgi:hypothetical protein